MLHFELYPSILRIHCTATDAAGDAHITYWFLAQILPILLLFSGSTELLHATAVTDHGQAIAFLGSSGVGKSTLLHHFLEQGGSLITDEHLALDRSDYTRALPSIPFYRPYRSLEDLGIPSPSFADGPQRLQRLYLLTPADPSAPVSATSLSSGEIVSALVNNRQYNLFNPEFLQFFPLVQKRFSGLTRLARLVPMRRLHVPRALHRLPEVYRFVREDLARPTDASEPLTRLA